MRITLRSVALFLSLVFLGLLVQMLIFAIIGYAGRSLNIIFLILSIIGTYILDNYFEKLPE